MAGAAAAARGAAGAAAGAAAVGAIGTPVGPPGGSVGNLIVGAAEGFGGKLMRTVSFLGCTLPVDFFIGSAPWGAPGIFEGMSAISLLQDNLAQTTVKLLIKKTRTGIKIFARFLPNGRERVLAPFKPMRPTNVNMPRISSSSSLSSSSSKKEIEDEDEQNRTVRQFARKSGLNCSRQD